MSNLNKHPWTAGNLSITTSALSYLEQHAINDYPNECCGYISGPSDDPAKLAVAVAMENLAVQSDSAPGLPLGRTARDYFVMNSLELSRAIDAGEAADQPVKVIYHSHPNGKGAYFSSEDRLMFGEGKELSVPVSFIVIGVGTKEEAESLTPVVLETKLWVFNALTKTFDESRLEIVNNEPI